MKIQKHKKNHVWIKVSLLLFFLHTLLLIPSTYSQILQNRDTIKTLNLEKDKTLLLPVFLDDTNISEEIQSMYISISFNKDVIDVIGVQVQNGILTDYSFYDILQVSGKATVIINGQGTNIQQGSVVEFLLKPLDTGMTNVAIESLNCNDHNVSGGLLIESELYQRIYIQVIEPEVFKISDIEDRVVQEDQPIDPVPFTINVPGDNTSMRIAASALSSNSDLIPQANLRIMGSGLNRDLYITSASNQFGSAEITVQAVLDFKEIVKTVFTINVLPVNDSPDFSMPSIIELPETSGPQNFPGWATQITAGPENEKDQSLEFLISVDRTDLFYKKPEIDVATGNLFFFPVDNIHGNAIVSVHLKDDGGIENEGQNLSPSKNFTLSIKPFSPDLSENSVERLTCITSNQPISSQTMSSFIRIMASDANGKAVVMESDTQVWLKTEASETGWFYVKNLVSGWSMQKSNAIIVIPEGEYSAMFKYINAKPGNWQITATEMPDLGWIDATLTIHVENDSPYIPGDINENGNIDLSDIIRTMKKIMNH
ncbi:conserved hypothetical protein, secreted [Candidatus Magnetomorum sp. HK-1]|nr:conserved hypothetical protein, secreted [Candidatus Magnetomorum sp. HK-1]